MSDAAIRTPEKAQTWGGVSGEQVRKLAEIIARRIENDTIEVRVDRYRWGITAETWKIHVNETKGKL